MTKDLIKQLQRDLQSHRLEINDAMFEQYVNGSNLRVNEAIVSQVNDILDERDASIINVLEKIISLFEKMLSTRDETKSSGHSFSKEKYVPANNRRGVS